MHLTEPLILIFLLGHSVNAFSNTLFQETKTKQLTFPSDGIEIELPNFDELFLRIQQVSPLARLAIDGARGNGFNSIDDSSTPNLKWRTVEKRKNKQGIFQSKYLLNDVFVVSFIYSLKTIILIGQTTVLFQLKKLTTSKTWVVQFLDFAHH